LRTGAVECFIDATGELRRSHIMNNERPALLMSILGAIVAANTSAAGPGGATGVQPGGAAAIAWQSTGPLVLRVERTAVGLLYTPDTLAALVAGRNGQRASPRIREAVRLRTPIVLMWSIPPAVDLGPAPRPFKVAITESHSGPAPNSPYQIEPAWVDEDASDLIQLDRAAGVQETGAIAAFPLDAFVPGRRLFIYSEEPYTEEKEPIIGQRKAQRLWTRGALVEWDGRAAQRQR
jgi:hypothetical protein